MIRILFEVEMMKENIVYPLILVQNNLKGIQVVMIIVI